MTHLTQRQSQLQSQSMQAVLKLLDITKFQLAETLNVSYGLVCRWVRGAAPISARSAYRISVLIPEISPDKLCFTLDDNIRK